MARPSPGSAARTSMCSTTTTATGSCWHMGGLLPRDQLALQRQRPHVRIASGAWLKHAVSELAETAKPARSVRIAPPAEAASGQAARDREATADTHSEPGGRRVA